MPGERIAKHLSERALTAAGDHALRIHGAKSPEAGGRSKGMAVRGLVRGDPRSGEDERQRTFRRPPGGATSANSGGVG